MSFAKIIKLIHTNAWIVYLFSRIVEINRSLMAKFVFGIIGRGLSDRLNKLFSIRTA